MDISIIIPLYNEAESLSPLFEWVKKVMDENRFSYEVIFVNDGSTDNSWQVINELSQKFDNIHAIRFRKNYGKSPALFCGFEKAQGDVVITLDADLQDSPDEIPALFSMIKNDGFDLVSGWKQKRYDNALTKNIPSKIYNSFARKVTGLKLHDMNCGIKAYRKEVVKNIEVYGEMHRYIPYLAKNAGFTNIGEKVVEHRKREFGSTKFGMERFVNGYLDLFSLWFLSKFGKKPMHFFGLWGSVMFLVGLIAIILVGLVKYIALKNHTPAPLVTSTPWFYIALTMMILGTQMFLTGFLGELVARNSEGRNQYNIREEF
ncbi:MAG: glycosyltransferase family 2 protein [Prevotellaceae bacterium]|jgi:glycosyltransferase involved in cell wall biosynthesis|nr:glycosyltransferase family 2 protein [Prevotellaceae bacterium]